MANGVDTRIPVSQRQISVEYYQMGDEIFHSVSLLVTPGGIAPSDCENADVLVDSLEDQFQPAIVPSVPAFDV
jgi:hypothetical protein